MSFNLEKTINSIYTIFKKCNGDKEGVAFLGSFFYFNVSVVWSLVGILLFPFFPFVFNSIFGFVLGVAFYLVIYFVLGCEEVEFEKKYSPSLLYLLYFLILLGSICLVGVNLFLGLTFS